MPEQLKTATPPLTPPLTRPYPFRSSSPILPFTCSLPPLFSSPPCYLSLPPLFASPPWLLSPAAPLLIPTHSPLLVPCILHSPLLPWHLSFTVPLLLSSPSTCPLLPQFSSPPLSLVPSRPSPPLHPGHLSPATCPLSSPSTCSLLPLFYSPSRHLFLVSSPPWHLFLAFPLLIFSLAHVPCRLSFYFLPRHFSPAIPLLISPPALVPRWPSLPHPPPFPQHLFLSALSLISSPGTYLLLPLFISSPVTFTLPSLFSSLPRYLSPVCPLLLTLPLSRLFSPAIPLLISSPTIVPCRPSHPPPPPGTCPLPLLFISSLSRHLSPASPPFPPPHPLAPFPCLHFSLLLPRHLFSAAALLLLPWHLSSVAPLRIIPPTPLALVLPQQLFSGAPFSSPSLHLSLAAPLLFTLPALVPILYRPSSPLLPSTCSLPPLFSPLPTLVLSYPSFPRHLSSAAALLQLSTPQHLSSAAAPLLLPRKQLSSPHSPDALLLT